MGGQAWHLGKTHLVIVAVAHVGIGAAAHLLQLSLYDVTLALQEGGFELQLGGGGKRVLVGRAFHLEAQ